MILLLGSSFSYYQILKDVEVESFYSISSVVQFTENLLQSGDPSFHVAVVFSSETKADK